jgi:hypothetical protein
MTAKDRTIAILSKELEKQKAIFRKHMGRAINPDGSDEYKEAKTEFDAADRKIKELDKEIARIVTGGTPLSPKELKEKFPYLPKRSKKRQAKKKSTSPAGQQTQPSQSKVRLGS